MNKLFLLLVAMVLSGCSSMVELRESKPNAEFSSSKSVKDVSECILFGWQEKSQTYGPIFIQPHPNGMSVYSASEIELADVVKENDTTNIKFYHQGGVFDYRIKSRVNVITNCI